MHWTLVGNYHGCRGANDKTRSRHSFNLDSRIYRVVDLAERLRQFDLQKSYENAKSELRIIPGRHALGNGIEGGKNGTMVVFNSKGVAQVNSEGKYSRSTANYIGEYYKKIVLEKTAFIRGYCIVTCGNKTLAHNFTLPMGL